MSRLKFLPKLGTERPATPGNAWKSHQGLKVLQEFAESLIVQAAHTPAAQLKSVPSPWARALLFDHALRHKEHTSHNEIVDEWRGLLGCIALSEHLNLNLEVLPLTLDEGDAAAGGPTSMEQALVQLAPDGDAKWTKIGLIRIREQVIGGLSPRTIVFTGIRDIDCGVPFTRDGRLYDPLEHYFRRGSSVAFGLITEWITHVKGVLSDGHPLQGYLENHNDILQLFSDWSDDAEAMAAEPNAPRTHEGVTDGFRSAGLDVHGAQHSSGALSVIPVVVPSADLDESNQLRLTPELSIDPGLDGIILRDDGTPYTGLIELPMGFSQEVTNGRLAQRLPANALEPSVNPAEYFEGNMIEVVGARPRGGALSAGDPGDSRSFLFPFKPELIEKLGSDLVRDHTTVDGPTPQGYRVSLKLPLLSGFTVSFERSYTQTHVRSDRITPAVATWPNFEASDWTDYFYVIDHLKDDTTGLKLSPLGLDADLRYESPDGGRYLWGHSKTRVEVWKGKLGDDAGLLIPGPPSKARAIPEGIAGWDVSIDFGSTHTRVFRKARDVTGNISYPPLKIQARSTTLLGEDGWDPTRLFFPGPVDGGAAEYEELQSLLLFPLGQYPDTGGDRWLPAMGLIFFTDVQGGAQQHRGLRSHLKWHDPQSEDQKAFRSYLQQLLLLVRAEAREQRAKIGTVAVAYPGAFNQSLFLRHRQVWESILPPGSSLGDPMTESTALANYIHHKDGIPLEANVSAVDIGGSTSDISVWSNGSRTRAESVRLAGELISRLVRTDGDVREALSQALRAPQFAAARVSAEWSDDEGQSELLYNSVLRSIAEAQGHASEIAPGLHNTDQDAGTKLLFHIAYLFAALSYVMGLLRREEAYKTPTYYVHFGGHGSDYLNWLDTLEQDAGKSLVKSFFLAGVGLSPNEAAPDVEVRVSGDFAKHEVGIGLLHNEYEEQADRDGQHKTFLGETGFTSPDSGEAVDPWKSVTAATLKETIKDPKGTDSLESREFLKGFVDAFQATPLSERVARGLGLGPEAMNDQLLDMINNKLFQPSSAFMKGEDARIFEPVILTEIKVLLEKITGNSDIFTD